MIEQPVAEALREQLRSTERLLAETQRLAHIGTFNWNLSNRTVSWSDELYRIFGVQPREIDPVCEAMAFLHEDDRSAVMSEIQSKLKTKEPYSFFYRIRRRDGAERTLHSRGYLMTNEYGDTTGVFGTTQDVTERKQAEESLRRSEQLLRQFATRLMHAQDDERRRIAQMLHETTAQDLAALKMLLARLNRTSERLSAADRALLDESGELAERSMSGVRTLSYLLHPPFLDEIGLLSAVRWYAEGFTERSGIKIDLDLPETFERLPQDVETTLFRVVQEALINIHRHAESPTARIRLQIDGERRDRLTLEIQDSGRGMPTEGAFGVGITGMRERLKQLAGMLEIESSDPGTIMRAVVPLSPNPS